MAAPVLVAFVCLGKPQVELTLVPVGWKKSSLNAKSNQQRSDWQAKELTIAPQRHQLRQLIVLYIHLRSHVYGSLCVKKLTHEEQSTGIRCIIQCNENVNISVPCYNQCHQ